MKLYGLWPHERSPPRRGHYYYDYYHDAHLATVGNAKALSSAASGRLANLASTSNRRNGSEARMRNYAQEDPPA